MALRLTTWNIGWFGQLLKGFTRTIPTKSKEVRTRAGKALQREQKEQIAEEIRRIDPDVLCIQEGPSTGNVRRLEAFCDDFLDSRWSVVLRKDGDSWLISGSQAIYYLVKSSRMDALQPKLLSQTAWIEATEQESRVDPNAEGTGEHKRKWPIIHPLFKPDAVAALPEPDTGDDEEGDAQPDLDDREHSHWRHPQVLVLTVGGKRVDLIGCHLKSKFGGDDYAKAGRLRQQAEAGVPITDEDVALIRQVEQTAVESRIKLSTEIANIRYFVEHRFRNEPHPALFILGDFNDGVGKEVFERKYLFHDAISNLQGDVFFARRFLNHGLFDFSQGVGENHRWSARFSDVWDPRRPPEILLDHIMFTQGVVGEEALSRTGLRVRSHAGRVEHEIHNAVNAVFDREEDHTSDHRPVTLDVTTAEDLIA
ncbi:MAG: hypothetical protein AAFR35_10575 [Pseudomonadota bacterium]